MKKIFAIALAVVMILSIASVASAFTWNKAAEPAEPFGYSVDVIKFTRSTGTLGSSSFNEDNAATAVNGADVYWAIKLVVPSLSYNSGTTSYAGNYIPYAPTHTFALSGDYSINVGKWIDRILLHCDLRGAGPFYWNEENSLRQPFYSLLGASVGIQKRNWTLSFWGSNLIGTDYDVFYFMSIGNSFVQHGNPRQLGVSLQINLNTL